MIQQRQQQQQQISNLSPSSMEVDFSDPYQLDYTSFSRRQAEKTFETVSTRNNLTNDDNEDEEQKRDAYVRSGTQFRSLLDCAIRKVVSGYSNSNKYNDRLLNSRDSENGNDDRGDSSLIVFQDGVRQRGKRSLPQDGSGSESESGRPLNRRRLENGEEEADLGGNKKFTAKMARQKMSEVLSLRRVSNRR